MSTTTPVQSEPRNNSNALHPPQNSRIGALPSDGLVAGGGGLTPPLAEMQSAELIYISCVVS